MIGIVLSCNSGAVCGFNAPTAVSTAMPDTRVGEGPLERLRIIGARQVNSDANDSGVAQATDKRFASRIEPLDTQ